jgi:hypothetical protein
MYTLFRWSESMEGVFVNDYSMRLKVEFLGII